MDKAAQNRLDLAYLTAAQKGDAAEVDRCLKAGATMYICNAGNGWNAMNFALNNLRLDVIRTLVDNGYDPNRGADDEHRAPVIVWALSERMKPAVDALVEAGADINIKNKGNKPPLVFCMEENNRFGVSYLMRAGADPEPAMAWLENRSDIKWSGGTPTDDTVELFQKELAARRQRDGLACQDAIAKGCADVAPLKPLRFKTKPAAFARF